MAYRNRFRIVVLTSVLLLLGFLFLTRSTNMVRTFISSNDGQGQGGHQQHTMKITAKTAYETTTTSRSSQVYRSPSSDGTASVTVRPSKVRPHSYTIGLQQRGHKKNLRVTEDMSPESAEETFLQYLNRVDVDCAEVERIGNTEDGGWNVCVAGPYKPVPSKCLVYSFGFSNRSYLQASVFKAHGCVVRSMDRKLEADTFGQHLRNFQEDDMIIDYLKYDLDEWESLEVMCRDKSLVRVKQLALGVYLNELQTIAPRLTYFYSLLEQLDQLGFRKWCSHTNTDGVYMSRRSNMFIPCCVHMVFINTNFIFGPVTPLPPLELDHPSPSKSLSAAWSTARLITNKSKSQSHGDTPPEISFLPDAGNLSNISTEFKIIQKQAYDIPEDNNDINPALKSKYAASLFMNYIRTMQVRCPAPVRLGHQKDGGWDVCITPPYNLERNCTVYSFGIGGDWSFDDAVVTKHHCNVYAFDPTIKLKEHTRLERIAFFPLGLGGTNRSGVVSKLPLRTFRQYLEKFRHTEKVIDVVKIDIEYSEWQALDTMAHDGSLSNVKQLMFEIHTEELKKKQSVTSHFVYYWRIIRNLHKLGFRLWHTHMNTCGPFMLDFPPKQVSCCYELHFLNINFVK